MEQTADLAVVGGGSTAISFLAQLVAALQQGDGERGRRIVVFEPMRDVGPGEPYADDLSTNLLNVPAGKMSAYAEDRGHFLRWVKRQEESALRKYGVTQWDANTFLPRPLFGAYLREVWQHLCLSAGAMGVQICRIAARVDALSLDPDDGSVHLETCVGHFNARRVVLCNGNLPTASYADLRGCHGYFNSPYPVADLVRQVGPEASVGVIGTSLSAIDAIVALKEAGHAGPMLAVSRSGRLPAVRSTVDMLERVVSPTAAEFASLVHNAEEGLRLEALFGLLSERLAATGEPFDLSDMLGYEGSPNEALGQEIDASLTRPRSWQAIAVALNPDIEHAWRLMRDSERRRFYKEWRALWMIRRATFPMANAVKIKRYLESETLQIYEGKSDLSIAPAQQGQGFDVRMANVDGEMTTRHVDCIVNATGMSTDVAASSDLLVQSLLRRGLASADPYGGFRLDFDTGSLMDAGGKVIRNISVLGSLAVGTYFWTMSLDVNARLALEQARRIAGELMAPAIA